MGSHTFLQWMLIFYIYCFLGWCFESTYVSIKSKELVNRGFMRGPFLPLYGSGAMVMLFASMPFQDNLILVYLSGCIGATALEYVTGVTMEALFKVRYWDYSEKPLNFQGQICLSSTIAWGFLTIFMTEVIQKGVDYIINGIPLMVCSVLSIVLSLLILSDFLMSFKTAMDLRNVLIKMQTIRDELEKMEARLDIMLKNAGAQIAARSDFVEKLKLDELKQSIEKRFESMKELGNIPSEYFDSIKEEVGQLFEKFHINLSMREGLMALKSFYQRNMIKGNPQMLSQKYREELEELKLKALTKLQKKS